jgi:hypothetical protein
LGQNERVLLIMDMLRGSRWMAAFRKLPTIAPKTALKGSMIRSMTSHSTMPDSRRAKHALQEPRFEKPLPVRLGLA